MDLVTGATGIVGAHVLLECARKGPVRAIHRAHGDRSIVERIFRHYGDEGQLSRVQWQQADVEDVDALSDAMLGIRYVYHAAAIVSFDPRDATAMHRVNVRGTARVVNTALAQGVERLCHVSSTAAIGAAAAGLLRNEELPWAATKRTSAYAMSKYAAELEVQRGIAEGLDAVIVNPCVVLGPGIPGRSSMTLVERLRKGTKWYPPGSNAVVDARDVAACMVRSIERGGSGERYLLVGENIRYQALFGLMAQAFEQPIPDRAIRPWMLQLGWRLEKVRSTLLGSVPLLTAATAHSALIERGYDASKARKELAFEFRSAKDAVENVARFLREQAY
jgi:nucleoside-diphosphate-sugar epimerase